MREQVTLYIGLASMAGVMALGGLGFVFMDVVEAENPAPRIVSLLRPADVAQVTASRDVADNRRKNTGIKPERDRLAYQQAVPPSLPAGYTGHWKTVSLDNNQVQLKILTEAMPLSETQPQRQQGSGADYFRYAGYLYEQMAYGVTDDALHAKLLGLSREARSMGRLLDQSFQTRFEGAPSEDMTHLQVRSQIMFSLNQLNPRALHVIDLNQQGRTISPSLPHQPVPGSAVLRLRTLLSEVAEEPAAARYPETMALAQAQGRLLDELSQLVSLRWESEFYCEKSGRCADQARTMRVYAILKPPAGYQDRQLTVETVPRLSKS